MQLRLGFEGLTKMYELHASNYTQDITCMFGKSTVTVLNYIPQTARFSINF